MGNLALVEYFFSIWPESGIVKDDAVWFQDFISKNTNAMGRDGYQKSILRGSEDHTKILGVFVFFFHL